jgi:nucleotide-binding universal stress UspA family protein
MLDGPILVPVDGSELSEKALPYAVSIARATGRSLTLLTVWEGVDGELFSAPSTTARDIDVRGRAQREAYLEELAQRVAAHGTQVSKEMRDGHASQELLSFCDEHAPGLIVMATHGRSGIQRMWYGSVASKLMRTVPVPTLLVGPRVLERGTEPSAILKILVPLDGSPISECALEPAAALAEAFQAAIVLARAIRWPAQAFASGAPGVYLPEIEHELRADAESYLSRIREELKAAQPVKQHVLWALPAQAILEFVAQERIDLVVMASHSRTGVVRWALGSVADRVIQGTAPVLLIRPEAAARPARPE